MFGEPEDVEGQCNARLYVGDIHGEGHATFRCQLKPGHEGLHQEKYDAGDDNFPNPVTVTWEQDQSIVCEKHGRQRMDPPDEGYPDQPACRLCASEYWDKKFEEEENADGCEDC